MSKPTHEPTGAKSRWQQECEDCDICSGRAVYRCPICDEVIENHSHENDFICRRHSFVNPIRDTDGAQIVGDGHIHGIIETSAPLRPRITAIDPLRD